MTDRPMNPQSTVFPSAPGEGGLLLARPYQHAGHNPSRTVKMPLSGRDAIRADYRAGTMDYEKALDKLRKFRMSWHDADTFLGGRG